MDSYRVRLIEQAERTLESIRRQNTESRSNARLKVYAKVPRIEEIDTQIRTRWLNTAKVVIDGQNSRHAIASFKKELADLIREKKELLRENGFSSKYMDRKYKCSKCKDKGHIDSKYCKCRDDIIRELSFKLSGLSSVKLPSFNEFNMNYYSKDYAERGVTAQQNATKILEFCFNYEHGNLLFYGGAGLGKTFVSGCIARKLIDIGKIVCYMSAPEMFGLMDDIKFGRSVSPEEQERADLVYSADLLIIDDLGTEFRTSFTDSVLFNIINSRLIHNLSTVINTNMDLNKLMEAYSERVSSRIAGEYRQFKFIGEDIRRVKKKTKK